MGHAVMGVFLTAFVNSFGGLGCASQLAHLSTCLVVVGLSHLKGEVTSRGGGEGADAGLGSGMSLMKTPKRFPSDGAKQRPQTDTGPDQQGCARNNQGQI